MMKLPPIDLQLEAARRLGRMVAEEQISQQNAQEVLALVVKTAAAKAPQADRSGLRARLVWAATDAKQAAFLERMRRERQQERELATIAERELRAGATPQAAAKAIATAAMAMAPRPPIESGEAALRLAQWRVKHG